MRLALKPSPRIKKILLRCFVGFAVVYLAIGGYIWWALTALAFAGGALSAWATSAPNTAPYASRVGLARRMRCSGVNSFPSNSSRSLQTWVPVAASITSTSTTSNGPVSMAWPTSAADNGSRTATVTVRDSANATGRASVTVTVAD